MTERLILELKGLGHIGLSGTLDKRLAIWPTVPRRGDQMHAVLSLVHLDTFEELQDLLGRHVPRQASQLHDVGVHLHLLRLDLLLLLLLVVHSGGDSVTAEKGVHEMRRVSVCVVKAAKVETHAHTARNLDDAKPIFIYLFTDRYAYSALDS